MGSIVVPPQFQKEGETMLSMPPEIPHGSIFLYLSIFLGAGNEVRRKWEFV
jgi:hypothetical protein